jgi:hypothetical protein
LENDGYLCGSGRCQTDEKRDDVEKSERNNPEAQSIQNPSQLPFYDEVWGFEPVSENDDKNTEREQSKKKKGHPFEETVNCEHKFVVMLPE